MKKYIHQKLFDVTKDVDVKVTNIENKKLYIIDNIFLDIDNILSICQDIPVYHQNNGILACEYFSTNFLLYDLNRFISRITQKDRHKLTFNFYNIKNEKIERYNLMYPRIHNNSVFTYRLTIFLNKTFGLNFYKNKLTNTCFSNQLYFDKYEYKQVFKDEVFFSQWDFQLKIEGAKNRAIIYPIDIFHFLDFDNHNNDDRFTMEFSL